MADYIVKSEPLGEDGAEIHQVLEGRSVLAVCTDWKHAELIKDALVCYQEWTQKWGGKHPPTREQIVGELFNLPSTDSEDEDKEGSVEEDGRPPPASNGAGGLDDEIPF